MSSMLTIALLLVSAGPNPDYGKPAPQKVQAPPTALSSAKGKLNISKPALKAISELIAAVDANDTANIPAKLAAAQAVAQSSDERFVVGQLQLKAGAAANDDAAIKAGIEAMLASGGADPAQIVPLHMNLGKIEYKNKRFAPASMSFERVLAINPTHTDALILLAESRNAQGRANDAVTLMQRAVQARTASGQKAEETWYKRAVGLAYEAKLPIAAELSRQWVAAYPTPANWRDALRIYRGSSKLDDAVLLDTLRLARATGALAGDIDFHLYAFKAADASPGEARAVIEEAIAAKQIDPNKPLFKDIVATLNTKKALGLAGLPQLAIEAKAGPAARLAVRTADALYGYGEYAQAAELYQAALAKTGADPDLINLHLGMALARAGDKAGATAALNSVNGPRSELAKFWLVYVETRA